LKARIFHTNESEYDHVYDRYVTSEPYFFRADSKNKSEKKKTPRKCHVGKCFCATEKSQGANKCLSKIFKKEDHLSVQLAIKNISRHFTFFPTMLQEHGKIFIEFHRKIGI